MIGVLKNRRSASPSERGLLTTEMAILMPVLVAIALVAVFVATAGRHSSRAQQAADAAARAASLERTEPAAYSAAQAAAARVCNGTVEIDPGNFRFEPPDLNTFTPGHATVGLTCTEDFSAFGFVGSTSTRTENGVAVAVIEYWLAAP